ncbi:MAG: hypothetical protein KF753_20255 [Caldilineaceae bacterium]|nr:hypothetical protein [Caldilineaceae bacterium]
MAVVTTLDKIKRLEKYIAAQEVTDTVFDLTLDKLLNREVSRLERMQEELNSELADFEQSYGIESEAFYRRYEAGEMGDATDFIEWSSTVEMVNNIEQQLGLLQNADQ